MMMLLVFSALLRSLRLREIENGGIAIMSVCPVYAFATEEHPATDDVIEVMTDWVSCAVCLYSISDCLN